MNESQPRSYTGRRRDRRTRPGVKLSDAVARAMITVGGIGTIVAVLLVAVFLILVAAPLFRQSSVSHDAKLPAAWKEAGLWHVAIDEYQQAGWALLANGEIVVFRADTGELVERRTLSDGPELTAASFAVGNGSDVALGFADGTVRLGRIGISSELASAEQLPESLRNLAANTAASHEGTVISRLADGQFRRQRLEVHLEPPIAGPVSEPVRALDHFVTEALSVYCALWDGGKVQINEVRQRRNLIDGSVTLKVRGGDLPFDEMENDRPSRLLLSGLGDNVLLAWNDGRVVRFDTRDIKQPQIAEKLDLLPEEGLKLTAAGWLLGRSTLIVGDSSGRVRAWFRTKPDDAETVDRNVLTLAHELPAGNSAVTALATSAGSRVLAAGMADGRVRLYQVTNESLLAETAAQSAPVTAVAISPKDDGLLAAAGTTILRWQVNLAHPEATLTALFRPVWYEGYEQPEQVWQSSSGTNDEEPKYGLMPLIFGTLKATIYSLLFGVPLALAAAVFTSEFTHRKVRARIKPAIEMMASLPSVVLGFLAALVIAPLVDRIVPTVLVAFFVLPLVFLLGAYLWQLAPQNWTLKLARWRFLFILAALPIGLWLSSRLGPVVERRLLAGDFKAWVDGQVGSGVWAWMLLFLPLSAVGVLVLGREINGRLKRISSKWERSLLALVDLVKFTAGVIATFMLAWGLSHVVPWMLSLLFNRSLEDPRGTFVATYDQRNALVVGFMMGFAIIPLIYTIADDALAAVPDHLRSASLGAGATPWQTATRIVIPTAMSGLFSAVMIGLGRAVGETMIVLMAAGNTPLMDWNIFNGFRTLSANLAVEVADAVPGSTHYRVLFLAALVLFAMTFAVNTVAELIRMRFRRRSHEL